MVHIGAIASWKSGVLAVVVLTLLAGCGGQTEATRKQLSEMNRKLVTVENDNARLELRLAATEEQVRKLRTRSVERTGGPTQSRLKVIKLAPEAPAEELAGPEENSAAAAPVPAPEPSAPEPKAAVAEEDTERPVIRIDGDQILDSGVPPIPEEASPKPKKWQSKPQRWAPGGTQGKS